MRTLNQIVATNYMHMVKYTPRQITIQKESKYTQTAGNCWVYSVLNNQAMMTGIDVAPDEFKNYLKTYWFSPEWPIGNDTKYSWSLMCEFLKLKGYNVFLGEIDVMKSPKLFAEMLLAWYAFIYTRDCHDNVLADIRDNDEINTIIITKWAWHAVNLCLINKKLTEFGSRWDNNIYNNFTYENTNIFMRSIQAWAIVGKVRFLDFRK